MVARRVVADGRLNGVAIVPSGEWGTRVAAAFADESRTLGGNVLDSGRYDPAQVDFSDVIKSVMQLKPTKVEKGEKPEPPTHRSDAAFIFVAASTRRHGAPHPAAAEIQLFRRRARLFHLRQLRAGSQCQLRYRRDVLPGHAVDDFQRPCHRADPRQRACSMASPHRAPRPLVRLRVRRLSVGARFAVGQTSRFEQHRRRDRKITSRSAE